MPRLAKRAVMRGIVIYIFLMALNRTTSKCFGTCSRPYQPVMQLTTCTSNPLNTSSSRVDTCLKVQPVSRTAVRLYRQRARSRCKVTQPYTNTRICVESYIVLLSTVLIDNPVETSSRECRSCRLSTLGNHATQVS